MKDKLSWTIVWILGIAFVALLFYLLIFYGALSLLNFDGK